MNTKLDTATLICYYPMYCDCKACRKAMGLKGAKA